MKSRIDCVHCYLKQAVSAMRFAGIDEDMQHQVVYQAMDDVKQYDRKKSPAYNSTEILLKTYRLIGNDDPYKEIKKKSNDLALEVYPELEKEIEESSDRLLDALKFSVAGNVIDLGIHRSFDMDEALHHVKNTGFAINHYDVFKKHLEQANNVMILGDNTGEIVFDKLLVKELTKLSKDIVYVVKEGPILNDATLEDAKYVGMDRLCRVMSNGCRYLGTCLDKVSYDFLEQLEKADLVIAKGQANYESLEDKDIIKGKVFFMLRLKCEEVADNAGGRLLDMVLMKG